MKYQIGDTVEYEEAATGYRYKFVVESLVSDFLDGASGCMGKHPTGLSGGCRDSQIISVTKAQKK